MLKEVEHWTTDVQFLLKGQTSEEERFNNLQAATAQLQLALIAL